MDGGELRACGGCCPFGYDHVFSFCFVQWFMDRVTVLSVITHLTKNESAPCLKQ